MWIFFNIRFFKLLGGFKAKLKFLQLSLELFLIRITLICIILILTFMIQLILTWIP